MIDAFYIFTKGGLLLWSTQLVKVKGNPIDRLIKEVLLEERLGEVTACVDSYNLKWKLLNDMDLFFVVVYQGILQIAYLEALLERAGEEFLKHFGSAFGNGMNIKKVDFDKHFDELRKKADKELAESKRKTTMRSFADTKKGAAVIKTQTESGVTKTKSKKKGGGDKEGSDGEDEDADDNSADNMEAKPSAKKTPAPFKKKEADPDKPKKEVKKRTWAGDKASKSDMQDLDFSKKGNASGEDDAFQAKKKEFLDSDDDGVREEEEVESLSSGSDDEDKVDRSKSQVEAKPSRAGSVFKTMTRGIKNLTGGAVLTDEDLAPILKHFKESLMAKNVAAEVTQKLAESVSHSLVGKTTDRFTSMSATVKHVLKESMENLLTPKKSIDVLRAALAAKNAGRVYTIVFLGVNGVGKSTNLAKVAYYLKNKGGLNVLICACDTFRAGAVEQLNVHARCLDVPLFERGYGKDAADIAKAAIAHAKQTDIDVVLVDTAGRMQDNEPLMRAIAKLVAMNQPDLVLFVGEALVGNDAIDQVTKFNRSLVDFSHDPRNPRGIDGMLLTKYDTVDDKVGAALSMVYVTGQPIVFVGTGQKYTHLRKMQAKEVVKTLLG